MIETLSQTWPWYVAGPLLGLMVPLLLWLGNKEFGMSSNLQHICAAALPSRSTLFQYDWRREGLWNLTVVVGILIGAFVSSTLLYSPNIVDISESTRESLAVLGIVHSRGQLVPPELFAWHNLISLQAFMAIVFGGFLVGFGTRYAAGCTSGHGLTGTANLQPASFVALVFFFVGGLFATFVLFPLIF